MAQSTTRKTILFIIVFACCICFAMAFATGNAYGADDPVYVDFDLSLSNGTGVFTSAGILATATVWQGDGNEWIASPFSDYEIQYFSGNDKLASAPSAVGNYTAKAVSTYSGSNYLTAQGAPLTVGLVLKTMNYKIIYNHFAISYSTPESLIADGSDRVAEVGASIYCEGATLVEDIDYKVDIFFEDELSPTTEVIDVGRYTIKVKMQEDFVTSNVFTDNTFTYEFDLVSTAIEASLGASALYYSGEAQAPTLQGNITGVDFAGKFEVAYVEKISESPNGYRQSATPFAKTGDYIYRIIFTQDLPSYGIDAGNHLDLAYSIVPKPFVVNYYGDGASFGANNAIIKQSELGMTISAVFSTLTGQVINTITPSDYEITYWRYDGGMFKDLPYDGYNYDKPTGVGRYRVDLRFTRDIAGVFGVAYSDYKLFEDDVISYEFQIVNPVQYLIDSTYPYTGIAAAVNPRLSYSATPIENNPALTLYEVKYYYDGIENDSAPIEVGNYFGVVRFLHDYTQSGQAVAKAGDEYRFEFNICYCAPSVTIVYGESGFEISCAEKAEFAEGIDYTIETYLYKNGFYYITNDMSGLGTYRAIITIINEVKTSGLLLNDIYINTITVQGGNPAAITLSVANYSYNGHAKPVTVNFGTGVTRTLNVDYTITYYSYLNGVIDAQCGYPVLPGKYRAVLTFNKEDIYFGVLSGYRITYDYEITPIALEVAFTPDGTDLVYDKTKKYFTASFTANNRPVVVDTNDFDILFRSVGSTDYADFSAVGYANAGSYKVAAVFNTDIGYRQYGISIAENVHVKEQTFQIQALKVRVDFVLPVEEEAMYRAGGIEPEIKFYKTNDNANELTAVPVKNTDYVVSYRFGELYGVSYEEAPIDGKPTDTGRYLISMTTQFNVNIVLHSVTRTINGAKPDVDYSGICYADYQSGTSASAVFRVIPLPLSISAVFPESMYEDGTGKGCSADALNLTTIDVASGVGGVFDTKTVDNTVFLDDGLMTVEYYKRQSGGTATIGSALLGAPIIAGDYTLRVNFARTSGSFDPYVFSCYRIVGGMNGFGELTELPIHTEYYYDIPYRIEESEEIRIVFNKPKSFAYDGTEKAFIISFAAGDSIINLNPSDYEIKYHSVSDSQSNPYIFEGEYRIEVVFKKSFAEYKIVQPEGEGEYEKADISVNTITLNDTVTFRYQIFAPFILDWEWVAPSSLYYNGNAKNYTIRFFDGNNRNATVTLIYNIDYAIRYYKKSASGTYSLLTAAPSNPVLGTDNYIAELIFLRGLSDYRILKNNDDTKYIINSYAEAKALKDGGASDPVGLSILDNKGVLNAEIQKENRHTIFDIQKGVLEISGIAVSNKSFDNSKAAKITGTPVLTAVSGGMVMVSGVAKYKLEGTISAEFVSVGVGQNIAVDIITGYTLSTDGAEYYTLQYKALKANIIKLNVEITPVSVPRQYNPFYVDADNLSFSITESAAEVLASTLGVPAESVAFSAFTGALTREGANGVNDNVGLYPILIGTLALSLGNVTLSDGTASTLDANIALSLVSKVYEITPRTITITANAGQYKYYGDAEPASYGYSITNGSLLFNDCFKGAATRQSSESSGVKDKVGFYNISLSQIRIFDRNGEGVDVTANYNITRVGKLFEIKKKALTITPLNQTITYGSGTFDPLSVKVDNIVVTSANIGSILRGDVFAGRLGLEDTGERTEAVARKYRITLGTLCIRNASGNDVTHNYNLIFDTVQTAHFIINKRAVRLVVADTAILQKIYGNADPKIAFKVEGTALPSGFTFDVSSSLSRAPGEAVGSYNILITNENTRIKILENNINVTDYFNINITNRDDENHIVQFVIAPRAITVKIKDETLVKSNMTILPKLEYLDDDNKSLTDTLINALVVSYGAPPVTFVEGDNVITPIIVGTVDTDSNFTITLLPGTITVIFPENTLSQEEVSSEEAVFTNNKIVYSDFRIFNSLKMYQFTTDNGDTPSRNVRASIPVTEDMMGKKLYVLAVYQDGSIQLLNAAVEDNEIFFEDDNFYYILIGTVAIWPYVLLGAGGIVLLGGGIAMIISYHIRRKKRIAAGLIKPKSKKRGKRAVPRRLADDEPIEEIGALAEDNDVIDYNPDDTAHGDDEQIITSTNKLGDYAQSEEPDLSDKAVFNIEEPTADDTERIITSSNTRRFDIDESIEEDGSGDDLL